MTIDPTPGIVPPGGKARWHAPRLVLLATSGDAAGGSGIGLDTGATPGPS